MTTQPSSFSSDDSIDLRKIIESLLRRWSIIAAALALSAIVGVGFSFLMRPAVYEASGSALLPAADQDTGLGLAPEGYLAFAASGPVMDSVREQLGLDLNPDQLRQRFNFDLSQDQSISFTASAGSAESALLLADAWLDTYQRELDRLIETRFEQMQAQALQETELLSPQLAIAREDLARYDLEHNQSLSAIELAALQARLGQAENRLQEVMAFAIPGPEARLALPEDLTRPGSIETVGGGGESDGGVVDGTSPESLISIESLDLASDPAYIELSRNLIISQLLDLEQDLVGTQNRIRELDLALIPIAKSRLESLEKALAEEPEFMGAGVNMAPNPVYLALSQDRAETRILLEVERSEAKTLSAKVPILLEQIEGLRVELLSSQRIENARFSPAIDPGEVVALESTILELRPEIQKLKSRVNTENAARQRLEGHLTSLQAAYDLARSEQDRLVNLEGSLASYSLLTVVQPPTQPLNPVPSQHARNIALSLFLGLVIGVGAALLVDYYQGKPAAAMPVTQG